MNRMNIFTGSSGRAVLRSCCIGSIGTFVHRFRRQGRWLRRYFFQSRGRSRYSQLPSSARTADDQQVGRRFLRPYHRRYVACEFTLQTPIRISLQEALSRQRPSQFNESLKTWHADGTECENAFVPPAGGNICYGVWKDLVSCRTVKLHHIGLMFNSDGGLSAIFTDDETDTVAPDGKTYKGMFDFKLWPPSYDAVGVGKPIAEVKGTVAATRITVD